jgi:hypothetical protein
MALNKVTSISQWNPQGSCIERFMDNAAYTSAHPDDTLVLVGPARYSSVNDNGGGTDKLTAIGMMQQMSVAQQRAVQPVQAIGSGRSYFLAGKPNVQLNIGRLFAKGPNLNRALYKNLINDENVTKFNPEEPASSQAYTDGVFNLDSELFLIPFGLCVLFRDKSGGNLGSFYVESCMIQSYNIGIASGQNVVMENVTGLADRILPIDITAATDATANFFRTESGGNTVTSSEGDYTDFGTGTLR